MKFYIASRVKNKELVKSIHQKLIDSGHTVLSTWVYGKNYSPYENHIEESKILAKECLEDINECDVFILISDESGSGMYTELGVALSKSFENKIKIYIVGDYINQSVFFFYPGVKRFKTIDEVFEDLSI